MTVVNYRASQYYRSLIITATCSMSRPLTVASTMYAGATVATRHAAYVMMMSILIKCCRLR